MDAIVFAAGQGTRMGPLTDDTPKPLVQVADKPILTHGLERLSDLGVDQITIVVGYEGEAIIDHYGDQFDGVPVNYAWQHEREGIAHALRAASECVSGTVVTIHGDYIFGQSLRPVVEQHRQQEATATLLVEDVPDEEATGYGVCKFDEDGHLRGIVEKPADPPSNTVMTGCFVFEPPIFPAAQLVRRSDRGEFELADAIDLLLYAGYPVELVWGDNWLENVNTPADRDRVEARLQDDT